MEIQKSVPKKLAFAKFNLLLNLTFSNTKQIFVSPTNNLNSPNSTTTSYFFWSLLLIFVLGEPTSVTLLVIQNIKVNGVAILF